MSSAVMLSLEPDSTELGWLPSLGDVRPVEQVSTLAYRTLAGADFYAQEVSGIMRGYINCSYSPRDLGLQFSNECSWGQIYRRGKVSFLMVGLEGGGGDQPEWLSEVLMASRDCSKYEVVNLVSRLTSNAKALGRVDDFDCLDLVPVDELPAVISLAIARNTFTFRQELSTWEDLVERLKVHLDELRLDSSKLLRGLL
ncbi:hypothetical protein [Stenotrophomonas maltophilia]|uniref:hypothetical protein n=1 Tax=Stenotrophomonas maltophilia TaxID=40324 RepID=UPI001108A84B|nr:hypothetical protein [Stenotrophomonas maltophilia]